MNQCDRNSRCMFTSSSELQHVPGIGQRPSQEHQWVSQTPNGTQVNAEPRRYNSQESVGKCVPNVGKSKSRGCEKWKVSSKSSLTSSLCHRNGIIQFGFVSRCHFRFESREGISMGCDPCDMPQGSCGHLLRMVDRNRPFNARKGN